MTTRHGSVFSPPPPSPDPEASWWATPRGEDLLAGCSDPAALPRHATHPQDAHELTYEKEHGEIVSQRWVPPVAGRARRLFHPAAPAPRYDHGDAGVAKLADAPGLGPGPLGGGGSSPLARTKRSSRFDEDPLHVWFYQVAVSLLSALRPPMGLCHGACGQQVAADRGPGAVMAARWRWHRQARRGFFFSAAASSARGQQQGAARSRPVGTRSHRRWRDCDRRRRSR